MSKKYSAPQVFKVQRPIYPPDGDYLVYNQDKSIKFFLRSTPALVKIVRGRDKIYAYGTARFTPLGMELIMVNEVPDEVW
jgi:hypothetical protein